MNAKPMRLVRQPAEKTRQEIEIERIRERQKNAEFGMGTIDNAPTKNYLDIDEILRRSFRQVEGEK